MYDRVIAKLKRSTAELLDKKPGYVPQGKRMVSFSFDDFPRSSIENGARILEENEIYGTFYASLGKSGVDGIASKAEMLAVTEHGHELGCHTFSHINCGDASREAVLEDCARNRITAQEMSGLALRSFAYPFGEYRLATKRVIRSLYDTARTAALGLNAGRIDLTALRGVSIDMRTTAPPPDHWIDLLRKSGGWLIFFTHDVCDNPTEFGTTVGSFSDIVRKCRDLDFDIVTVGDGAKLLTDADIAQLCS